jgi:hypothetical protein
MRERIFFALKERRPGSHILPNYDAVRTSQYHYVEYETGEKELYDLTADPTELTNKYAGLAPATVRKIHSTLHKALSQAVSDGLVPRNAAAIKAPGPIQKRCIRSLPMRLARC